MPSGLMSPPHEKRVFLTPGSAGDATAARRVVQRREAVALSVLVIAGWGAALWVSQHVQVDLMLFRAALFVHLASLVAGLGAVLTVDFLALQWLMGRRTLREVLAMSGAVPMLVWGGLLGLMASGAYLSPDLSSDLTCLKLGLVLLVGLNGAYASLIQPRVRDCGDVVPRSLLLQGVGTALVSQVGWWGAALLGFINSQC